MYVLQLFVTHTNTNNLEKYQEQFVEVDFIYCFMELVDSSPYCESRLKITQNFDGYYIYIIYKKCLKKFNLIILQKLM